MAESLASDQKRKSDQPLRILVFTTLFPNEEQPQHGTFVAERLRHLLATGKVEAVVVAPVPWFFSRHPRFGTYTKYARVPREETWNGCKVIHPRYPVIPKVGMTLAPLLMAAWSFLTLRKLEREGFSFNLIDAHYFYPDGVAGALLAKWLGKPCTITARGTDVALIGQYALPRRMIRWAASRAKHCIAVCDDLRNRLMSLGCDGTRISTLRNGVDTEKFYPSFSPELRQRYSPSGPLLVSVGLLIRRKRQDLIIQAMAHLPEAGLVIVGEGEERRSLETLAKTLGVADRVHLVGGMSQQELRAFYSTADLLVHTSEREGMANVLLESMACGTRVLATPAGGTEEIINCKAAGRVLRDFEPLPVSKQILEMLDQGKQTEETLAYAKTLSWSSTTVGQLNLFEKILVGLK